MSDALVQLRTTAPSTRFVTESRSRFGHELTFDGNSKITARGGSFEAPVPNALSLVQVTDCPEATPMCSASCYVHQLERYQPAIHAAYRRNSDEIREAIRAYDGGDPEPLRHLATLVVEHVTAYAIPDFRWHVSGDVLDRTHAAWIRAVVARTPETRHWIYTRRTHPAILNQLLAVDGLTVNLSADRDNFDAMLRIWRRYEHHPRAPRLTYMVTSADDTPELPPGSVLFPDYALRPPNGTSPLNGAWWRSLSKAQRRQVCPVDYFGKGPSRRCGPCSKCLDPVGAP